MKEKSIVPDNYKIFLNFKLNMYIDAMFSNLVGSADCKFSFYIVVLIRLYKYSCIYCMKWSILRFYLTVLLFLYSPIFGLLFIFI